MSLAEKNIARLNPDDFQDPVLTEQAKTLGITIEPKGFSLRERWNKLLGKTYDGLSLKDVEEELAVVLKYQHARITRS